MRTMKPEEARALLLNGTRTGKLATVRRNGQPHVAPIWFVLDGDDVVFTTGSGSVKAKNMGWNQRVALAVDDETFPYAYVEVEGTVSVSDDLGQLRYWATKIASRYVDAERAEAYGARNAVTGELVVRLTPTKIVAEAEIAA